MKWNFTPGRHLHSEACFQVKFCAIVYTKCKYLVVRYPTVPFPTLYYRVAGKKWTPLKVTVKIIGAINQSLLVIIIVLYTYRK